MFLVTTFPLFEATQPDDTPLEDILDSMGLTELIEYIETQWGITIRDAEITRTNLGSVAALTRFIMNKRVE
jgi:acyl carrier protein